MKHPGLFLFVAESTNGLGDKAGRASSCAAARAYSAPSVVFSAARDQIVTPVE
jgi:hypothetical protein